MWCPDRPGLTAEISGFLSETGCNITDLNQHSDPDHDLFHLRTEFEVGDLALDAIRTKWADSALAKKSKWTINDHHQKAKVFLFCMSPASTRSKIWRSGSTWWRHVMP